MMVIGDILVAGFCNSCCVLLSFIGNVQVYLFLWSKASKCYLRKMLVITIGICSLVYDISEMFLKNIMHMYGNYNL